jgi:2-polyprenyl-3-methyl-5-hydroxy-6-metoxy-1,4-benzoquinol methylase
MLPEPKIEAHNAAQRRYYETRTDAENWRMLPARSPYIENHLDRLLAFAALRQDEKILDVGAGMGKYTLPLARRGFAVEALDLSPVLLETLSKSGGAELGIATHCADLLQDQPALAGRYDVVTGFFMLHHLIDIRAAFRQIHTLLRPGGRIAFLDVNPLCPLYYLQIFLTPSMRWSVEKGILNLTRRQVSHALTTAGFENLRLTNFGILPPPLRNRLGGATFERSFDALTPLRGFAAFQLIAAERG